MTVRPPRLVASAPGTSPGRFLLRRSRMGCWRCAAAPSIVRSRRCGRVSKTVGPAQDAAWITRVALGREVCRPHVQKEKVISRLSAPCTECFHSGLGAVCQPPFLHGLLCSAAFLANRGAHVAEMMRRLVSWRHIALLLVACTAMRHVRSHNVCCTPVIVSKLAAVCSVECALTPASEVISSLQLPCLLFVEKQPAAAKLQVCAGLCRQTYAEVGRDSEGVQKPSGVEVIIKQVFFVEIQPWLQIRVQRDA